jgi:transposase
MFFVGIDLHKKTIAVCVVDQQFRVVRRQNFVCADAKRIKEYFTKLGAFQAVVEATASYEWLWQLLEPLAQRLVLAHPKKLRIIAESTRKSDRLDAQVLAEFLARGMIPQAYRPTPRQRQHRTLVRHRCYLRRQASASRVKIRRIVSDYNADRSDLFTAEGLAYLGALQLTPADRFVVEQLRTTWTRQVAQVQEAEKQLRSFAQEGGTAETEARAVLESIPGVGVVTVDIILSEIGDIHRFRAANEVVAYAGLAPARRESAGKTKDLGITKDGSRLLRWAMVEAAWRLVRHSPRWRNSYEQLHKRRGKKKAIVAIARRLVTIVVAVWRKGEKYRPAA